MVRGSRFMVRGSGFVFGVRDSWFGLQGLGFGVWGLGFGTGPRLGARAVGVRPTVRVSSPFFVRSLVGNMSLARGVRLGGSLLS